MHVVSPCERNVPMGTEITFIVHSHAGHCPCLLAGMKNSQRAICGLALNVEVLGGSGCRGWGLEGCVSASYITRDHLQRWRGVRGIAYSRRRRCIRLQFCENTKLFAVFHYQCF